MDVCKLHLSNRKHRKLSYYQYFTQLKDGGEGRGYAFLQIFLTKITYKCNSVCTVFI